MKFFDVLLPIKSSRLFTYKTELEFAPGDYVFVPMRNSLTMGIVWQKNHQAHNEDAFKAIASKVDIPGMQEPMRKFISEFANYNVCSAGIVVKSLLKDITKLSNKKHKAIKAKHSSSNTIELNDEQRHAVDTTPIDKFNTTLIDGVTGSGKTAVYISLIKKAVDSEGQALILLPEILLASRLYADMGANGVVEWHSSSRAKNQSLYSIIHGEAKIIIGARSALLLPYKDLRMIVIDEEHDSSYKQDAIFCYNARDMAVLRGKCENIPVILSSATPSLETMLNIKNGKYNSARLHKVFHGCTTPDVEVVDMRQEFTNISTTLMQKICQHLNDKRQVMLFLNRRGYCMLTICRACGYKPSCINCSTWLVEHRKDGIYRCHYCDFRKPIESIDNCPTCKESGTLKRFGTGVEQVYEEVQRLFPHARISMLSSDTMNSRAKAERMLGQIINHEVDIIIGTQIIAKGHNFPNLTLIGIIDADNNSLDLRSGERTYQALHQVSGRVGRYNLPGSVIIQTHSPDSVMIGALKEFNRDRFYNAEMESRIQTRMPPFTRLCCITCSSVKREVAMQISISLSARLNDCLPVEMAKILGPSPSPIPYINRVHRYQILVKTEKSIALSQYIKLVLDELKIPAGGTIKVDMDPINCS